MGSTFTITIPLGSRPAQPTLRGTRFPDQDQPAEQREGDKVVLAIDDDPDVSYLLHENLAEAGYRVVGALTGREGLEKARELRPWAVTLDILMPQLDGWQLLHELKADTAARAPVIVLSIVDNKTLGYGLGAHDYLIKPFDREAILATLNHVPPRQGRLLVVDDDPAAERARLEQHVRTVIQKCELDRETLIQELRGLLQAYRGPIPKGGIFTGQHYRQGTSE